MSDKELLYIDDAISHLEKIEDFVNFTDSEVEDESFGNVLNDLITLSGEVKSKFMKLLK